MFYDNLMADVQPESGALAHRFGGKKGFENVLPDILRNAAPGIFTQKNHLLCIHIKMRRKKDGSVHVHHRLNRILNDIQGHLA